MSKNQRKRYFKTNAAIPDGLAMHEGIVLPYEYVAVDIVEELFRSTRSFNYFMCITKEDEIEKKDLILEQESDQRRKDYFLGVFFTYLSFAPIFGWMLGLYGIYHQKQTINNRKMMILSIVGTAISLALTAGMIIGVVLGL